MSESKQIEQRDHWHCLQCGGTVVETTVVESSGDLFEIERCNNCGARVE